MIPEFYYQDLEKKFQFSLIRAVEALKRHKEVYMILLFGSFARKDYSLRHSDLDVYVILGRKKKDRQLEQNLEKEVLDSTLETKAPVQLTFQYLSIEEEDKSLLVKMCEEAIVLFSRGIVFTNYSALGLKKMSLVLYGMANASQVNKNRFNRFINGYAKGRKKYPGIVDNACVIKAGSGAVLADGINLKRMEVLASKLGVIVAVKQVVYIPAW